MDANERWRIMKMADTTKLNEKVRQLQKELEDLAEVIFFLNKGFSSINDSNQVAGCLSVLQAELQRISSEKIADLQDAITNFENNYELQIECKEKNS